MSDWSVYYNNRHDAWYGYRESVRDSFLPADQIVLPLPRSVPSNPMQQYVQEFVRKRIPQVRSRLNETYIAIKTPAHELAGDLMKVAEFNRAEDSVELAELVLETQRREVSEFYAARCRNRTLRFLVNQPLKELKIESPEVCKQADRCPQRYT